MGDIVVGAGVLGRKIAPLLPRFKGFVDEEDPHTLGTIKNLPTILDSFSITRVFITISPSKSKKQILQIQNYCKEKNISCILIPSLEDMLSEHVSFNCTKPFLLNQLLDRPLITEHLSNAENAVKGKTILITGAAGSIGSELFQQSLLMGAKEVIALDNREFNLFRLEQKFPQEQASFVLSDICNRQRIKTILQTFKPDIIFHAAAYKHVHQLEKNPTEAVRVNIFGTQTIFEEAIAAEVAHVVLVSTDKAVAPASIMGATKAVAEGLLKHYAEKGTPTKFTAVRFGNVLGSSGSVVNIFKRQIAEGGPLTITHAEATRYFMLIEEAVSLIIASLALGKNNEIFVLNMGNPVKIIDLAKKMVQLSGYEERDISFVYSGLKEGEKLYEVLLHDEQDIKTTIPEIFISKTNISLSPEQIQPLKEVQEKEVIVSHLSNLISDFTQNH